MPKRHVRFGNADRKGPRWDAVHKYLVHAASPLKRCPRPPQIGGLFLSHQAENQLKSHFTDNRKKTNAGLIITGPIFYFFMTVESQESTLATSKTRQTIYRKLRIWWNEADGHIHLSAGTLFRRRATTRTAKGTVSTCS